MSNLSGMCVPICTPLAEGGEQVDEARLRTHIDAMLEAGVHIILVCGGTGEFAYLRADEKKRIAEIAGKHIDNRAAFMVQTSAINTADTIEYSKHATDQGADGVMILPPYFEGPDLEGVYYHYEQVAGAIEIPIMVYNIPQHSGFDITPAFFQRLLEIDNVRYIKDSTGDLVRIEELLRTGGSVFNGADPIALYALIAGCPGCVWGAINAMPEAAMTLYTQVRSGELEAARELWGRMLPAQLFFWNHVYNAGVKAAAGLSGHPVGPCRAPVRPLTAAQLADLEGALEPLGIGAETKAKLAV